MVLQVGGLASNVAFIMVQTGMRHGCARWYAQCMVCPGALGMNARHAGISALSTTLHKPTHYIRFYIRLVIQDWFYIPVKLRSTSDGYSLKDAVSYIRSHWPWFER